MTVRSCIFKPMPCQCPVMKTFCSPQLLWERLAQTGLVTNREAARQPGRGVLSNTYKRKGREKTFLSHFTREHLSFATAASLKFPGCHHQNYVTPTSSSPNSVENIKRAQKR